MKISEFYQQIPTGRHEEITVCGDRLFFDGEEYFIRNDGELKLVRSEKRIELKLEQIDARLGIK